MRTARKTQLAALAAGTLVLGSLAGCTEPPMTPPPPFPTAPTPTASSSASAAATALPDSIDTKPPVVVAKPFEPPAPEVVKLPNGMTVWLLERHTLPLVSVSLALSVGSANDPAGKEGLAHITADMLDEGAGSRNAIDVSTALQDLGVSLRTAVTLDGSMFSLTVLKRNLRAVWPAYVDVFAKPSLLPADFARVRELWRNELKARRAEPEDVARVAGLALHYGLDHPYGHPPEGTLRGAAAITVADVAAEYARAYRADVATLVIVGDVADADLTALEPELDRFARGAAPRGAAPPAREVPPAPAPVRRRVVVVDRPGAPQSVVSLLLPAVPAGHDEAPLLSRANIALGGSFTSRLNQDLREERGLTYGASSRLSFSRGAGVFVAHAAVQTDKTQEALAALMADVVAYAHGGPTPAETEKTRLVARADLVEAFEGVSPASSRLARLAGVGLPHDHDTRTSPRRDGATRAELADAARRWLDPTRGAVLVVGPKATVLKALEPLKLGPAETLTIE